MNASEPTGIAIAQLLESARAYVVEKVFAGNDAEPKAWLDRLSQSEDGQRLIFCIAIDIASEGVDPQTYREVCALSDLQLGDACAAIERRYTVQCSASDPCLEGGCSVGGEICLQPLLRNRAAYEKECAIEWAKHFAAHDDVSTR